MVRNLTGIWLKNEFNCTLFLVQIEMSKLTSMTIWQASSWFVARQARMTKPAAMLDGQKDSISWSRRERTAKYFDSFCTFASALAALR